jgi:Flp pilus assembly protein TadG
MRKPAGKSRIRRGVAAAEMAIVLPFMLLLFAVALDYCRVFYAAQTIQNCAYSAALYASSTASARPDVSSPAAAAQDAALAEAVSLNPPLLAGNVTTSIANGMATVTVTYNFPLLTPFMGKSITITRTATMGVVPPGPYWETNS